MKERAHLPSREYLRIGKLPASELELIMLRGETPDLAKIAGWEFRGTNTPSWARLLGIKKFMKGFFEDERGRVHGYNIPVKQNRVEEPWIGLPDDAAPKRFGFYRVRAVDPTERDNAYLHSHILHYGEGGNGLSPTATLRDYLVRVEKGSDDLLLGKAYVALGDLRVPTSYFVLERHRPSTFRRP
jgi:hypothetical protein